MVAALVLWLGVWCCAVALSTEQMAGSVSGTQVNAQTSAVLQAGGDVRIASELQTRIDSSTANGVSIYNERTAIGAVGGVNVASGTGVLSINAGRDVTLTAADLSLGVRSTTPASATTLAPLATPGIAAPNGIFITAGHDLTLDTLTASSRNETIRNATNFSKSSSSQDLGTSLQSQGNLVLNAGTNLTATAALIGADAAVALKADKGDLQLLAGQATSTFEAMSQVTKKGFLSKKTTTTYDFSSATDTVATQVSGLTVNAQAGQSARATRQGSVSVS